MTTSHTTPKTPVPSDSSSSSSLTNAFFVPVSLKLDDNNYLPWELETLATIEGHNLESHLQPESIPNQYITDYKTNVQKEDPVYNTWKRQDRLLFSWLLASLSPSLKSRMVGCMFSYQIWSKINIINASRIRAKIEKLKTQLRSIKKTSTMAAFLLEIQQTTDHLAAVGEPVSTSDHISAIFQGLSTEYTPVIASVLSRKDQYNIDEIEALLLAIEERVEPPPATSTVLPSVLPQANIAQSRTSSNQFSYGRGRGFGRRGRGRYGQRGYARTNNQSQLQCQVCQKFGHSAWDCYHRFNPNYQLPQQSQNAPLPSSFTPGSTQSTPQAYFSQTPPPSTAPGLLPTPPSYDPLWYPDTGASNHMTPDLNNLAATTPYTGNSQCSPSRNC